MRAFVAIAMPEAVAAQAAHLQALLGCGRAVPEEALHLTLAFLGEITDGQAEELDAGLQAIAAPVFTLELAGLETLGGDWPGGLVWRARPCAPLERLQRAVAGAARGAGIDLPRRRFRPHVTIARFGRGAGPAEAARLGRLMQARGDAVSGAFMVGGFTLYRSHLRAEGPIYEALADYRLEDGRGIA